MQSTAGLLLYSNLTGRKIGQSISIHAPVVHEAATYYEFIQFVQFKIDDVDEYRTKFVKWRKPKTGYKFWQYTRIENNNTGLVTVYFTHIMKGVYEGTYPNNRFTHRIRIGGSISNGQLQPAGGALNISVSKKSDGSYDFNVSGTSGQQSTFNFDPDELNAENANEFDFTVS